MRNKNQWIVLGIILLAAAALRFGPILQQRDFWYDEAFTGVIIREDWATMNDYIFRDVHPPLYYWLVKPWAVLGGYSPWAIRSFSAVLGLLIISSLYWIGKKMFSERAGFLAATIAAFSPFAILYSQEARMYALFGLLMLWTVWFFYRALETGERRYWIWWGVLGGLSFYTHYLSLFFFGVFFFAFLGYNRIFNETKAKKKARIINFFQSLNFFDRGFWLGAGVATIFFLSWFPFFVGHLARKSLGWVERATFSDIPETIQYFFYGHVPGKILTPEPNAFREFTIDLFGKERIIGPFFDGSALGFFMAIIMAILIVILWKRNNNRKEIYILSWLSLGVLILLIVISWFGMELYVARYFMPVAILIYLLLAGLLTQLSANRWLWLFVLAVYAATLWMLKPIEYKTGWYQATESGQLGSAGEVAIDNPFDYTSGRFYLGDRARMYNRYDPDQDFSLWIIIRPSDIITDANEIKKIPEVRTLDDENCDWPGLELKQVSDFGNLKLCEVR